MMVLVSFLGGCRAPQMVAVPVPAHYEYTAEDAVSLSELSLKVPSTVDLQMESGNINQSELNQTGFTTPSKFNYMRWVKGQWDTPLPNGKWRRITKWYVPFRNLYQEYVWTVVGRDYCGRTIFGWQPRGVPVEEDVATPPPPENTVPPKLY